MIPGAEARLRSRRQHLLHREWRGAAGPGAVVRQDPEHVWKHHAREPGDPVAARGRWCVRPRREVQGRNPPMNGHGKSDSLVVPDEAPEQGRPRNGHGHQGEPQTGTNRETGETAKGEPKVTGKIGSRRRRGWREGGWPRGICPSKACPGHRAGSGMCTALER